MMQVGVDCRFLEDGSLNIKSIQLNGQWLSVEQGRGWLDEEGRHVLILFPDGRGADVCLRSESLTWGLTFKDRRAATVV